MARINVVLAWNSLKFGWSLRMRSRSQLPFRMSLALDGNWSNWQPITRWPGKQHDRRCCVSSIAIDLPIPASIVRHSRWLEVSSESPDDWASDVSLARLCLVPFRLHGRQHSPIGTQEACSDRQTPLYLVSATALPQRTPSVRGILSFDAVTLPVARSTGRI